MLALKCDWELRRIWIPHMMGACNRNPSVICTYCKTLYHNTYSMSSICFKELFIVRARTFEYVAFFWSGKVPKIERQDKIRQLLKAYNIINDHTQDYYDQCFHLERNFLLSGNSSLWKEMRRKWKLEGKRRKFVKIWGKWRKSSRNCNKK